MTRQYVLFADVPDEIDESWRHGALLGGMANQGDNFEIARSFRQAAEILISRNVKDAEADELLFSVLYSYRHAAELYLKAILQPRKANT